RLAVAGRLGVELANEGRDAGLDLVADRSHPVEREILRVWKVPAKAAQARGRRAGLLAAGRDREVGPGEELGVELARHVIGGVEPDLGERLDDGGVGGLAGCASSRAGRVAAGGEPVEDSLGHHGAAGVGDADEEDVAHASFRPGFSARTIAACIPSATSCVSWSEIRSSPAAARPASYSLSERAPAMHPA